jgi:Arc/MetJ-type ribon-helix-helix transcriptional regulator
MQITIKRPDLERYVRQQVETGQFGSPDAVVEEALDRLAEDDSAVWSPEYKAFVQARLAEAEADIQAGRVIEVDEQGLRALCEDVKARGRERFNRESNG